MYLVVVAVQTRTGFEVTREDLREVLIATTAQSDRLQHSHIAMDENETVFSLYVQAADGPAALSIATQLCCRAMAATAPTGHWSVAASFVIPP